MTLYLTILIVYFYTSLILSFTPFKLPKKYSKDNQYKSLFCNMCGLITFDLNDTLYSNETSFESLVGFRLDSKGNKIRKESNWLQLHLSLEELCENRYKDKYRIGKRSNTSFLYLIDNRDISDIDAKNNNKSRKMEEQQKDKIREKIMNEFIVQRDEYIKNNVTLPLESNDNDTNNTGAPTTNYRSKEYYFKERKPRLLKTSSKPHKSIMDLCYYITEKFDDWLHAKQEELKKTANSDENEDDTIHSRLNLGHFCVLGFEQNTCEYEMFNQTIELILKRKKKKVEVPLPRIEDVFPELKRNETIIDNDNNSTNIEEEHEIEDDIDEEESQTNENEKNELR